MFSSLRTKGEILDLIEFQDKIFANQPDISLDYNVDPHFMIDSLIYFIRIRPFFLEKIVDFMSKIVHDSKISTIILMKSVQFCPVLCYYLFKNGRYDLDTVRKQLKEARNYISYLYFRDFLDDFDILTKPIIKMDLKIPNSLEEVIKTGFEPNSLGYIIKYDDLDRLKCTFENPMIELESPIEWSVFEWSLVPEDLTPFSVSAFFGSLNCFKYFLVSGCRVNNDIINSLIFSCQFDMIHSFSQFICEESLKYAIMYCRSELVDWMLEKYDLSYVHEVNLRSILYCVEKGNGILNAEYTNIPPLHYALEMNHEIVIHFLLENGADPNEIGINL